MFDYLNGELARRSPGEAVVDCGGVGWLLQVSLQCYQALPERGPVRLLVHVHQSESGQRLFGFLHEPERSLFRLLLDVRGIGPALALTLLSHETPDELAARIAAGDVKGLTRIKGIGKKTAERVILELKDRLAEGARAPVADHVRLVAQALERLGLTAAEAAERARRIAAAEPAEKRLDVLLRRALRAGASSAGA